jgi:hypothetical protein
MQQSAVKWLEDQIKSKHWKEMFIWQKEEVFKKANKMFEEQVKDAYNTSFILRDKPYSTADKYYNETFKSE